MKEINFEMPTLEEAVENAERVPQDEHPASTPLVRTFKADVSSLLEQSKTTKLDIVMAEKARRAERQKVELVEEGHGSRLGRTIFILGLLFAFGIGVGAYILVGARVPVPFLPQKESGEEKAPATQDERVILVTDSPREQILVDVALAFKETTVADGDIRVVKFLVGDASRQIQKEATLGELLAALGTPPPPQGLLQSLDRKMVYGIHDAGGLSGFLRYRSRSYPESFAGMLAWEPKMADALIPLLRPDIKKSDILLLRERAWKDERVGETNARVLRDPARDSALAYAFPDQQTLIIAGGRDALRSLLAQFRAEIKK